MTNNLLPEIDRFLARTGWSDYKFGIKAIKIEEGDQLIDFRLNFRHTA